jgi:PAS domain S-box-containing protein
MSTKLYALLLEDIPKDAELLREMLTDEGFELEMDVVETEPDYVSNLKRHNYDIIFADFTLPGFNGQAALELAKEICPNVPFICISGTIGEDRAVELLKQGATDYVLKDRMERLAFATRRALDAAVQLNKFRQTEIELQTNRKLLQSVINNALDAIFIKDINGRYLLINKATEKAIGKTASEVIGKDDTFTLSAKEAQAAMAADNKVIESCMPLTYEESYTLIDGNTHFFNIIKCPMFDDFGKPAGLFGIARDITKHRQMEQALRRSEAIQGKMVANIGDVIVIIDQNGINRYKSPNIEKWFGWKPEEVVGVNAWENLHPEDLDSTIKFMQSLMHEPLATGTMECRYQCKDGNYKWIEFTAVNLLHDFDINGILGNFHDITERKLAEQ